MRRAAGALLCDGMASRSMWLRAVAVPLGLLALPGCTSDGLVDGCEPPPQEDELLQAYAAEPVFAVRPPESETNGSLSIEKGCREIGPEGTDSDVDHVGSYGSTTTQVSRWFALDVGFPQEELTAIYDADIRARGWAPEPLDLVPPADGGEQAGLYYCRQVNGVPSFLSIIERHVDTPDRRAWGGLPVSPSPDGTWPQAGSIEVRIAVIRGMNCTQQ